jgi:hypothetical protein
LYFDPTVLALTFTVDWSPGSDTHFNNNKGRKTKKTQVGCRPWLRPRIEPVTYAPHLGGGEHRGRRKERGREEILRRRGSMSEREKREKDKGERRCRPS